LLPTIRFSVSLLLVVVPAVIAVMFVPVIVAVPIATAPMVPMASVAEAVVVIPPAIKASLEPAPLAHLADFCPAMLGLAAEKAVALDVALKLGLLTTEALTAFTVPFARLRGRRTA
jgi:hypothetical protein